jgi:sodium transport system permease protein
MPDQDINGGDTNGPSRAPLDAPARSKSRRVTAGLAGLFFAAFIAGNALLPSPPSLSGILITMYGLLLAPTLVLAGRLRAPVRAVLSLRRPSLRSCAGVLMLGFPVSLIASVVFLLQSHFFPVPPEVQDIFKDLLETVRTHPVLGLFAVAVSPGLCEEVLFRGLILHLFTDMIGPKKGAVVAGILFGLFHLVPQRVLVTAGLGVLLGFLTLHTRSIVPAMILHATYNLWLCMPALVGEERAQFVLSQPWTIPAGLALLLGGIALIRRGVRA